MELDPVQLLEVKQLQLQTLNKFNCNFTADGVDYIVSYAVTLNEPTRRQKNIKRSRCNSFHASGSGIEYGTAYNHKDITLGVSDCFAVRGIYEGIGGSTPLPPSAVLGSPSEHL